MLTILYRGPLSSCNYGCVYCPFAKRRETLAEHRADAAALQRFVAWVTAQTDRELAIFFTPWGEALLHHRYQQAIVRLTHLPHVRKVAIQTNLAGRLGWVEECAKDRLGLWATYHPTQTTRAGFLKKCYDLERRGVRFSVGVVGLKENLSEIAALRAALSASIYLWVNAYKRVENYYEPAEKDFLTQIDALFPLNAESHASLGQPCQTGATVISVDGAGAMRRCHFVPEIIGNIYQPDLAQALRPRPCPNISCGCHIGYVHLSRLGGESLYGAGLLERIPLTESLRRPFTL